MGHSLLPVSVLSPTSRCGSTPSCSGCFPPPRHQAHNPTFQHPSLHGQGPYAVPGMSPPPPSSAMMNMQQELVYQVQFKRNCRAFTLRSRAGFTVNERDFVVVEADRGEDIGIVVEIMTMHAFLERRMNAIRPSSQQGVGVEQEDQNVGCILRLATLHERQQLPDKFHAEKDIVQVRKTIASFTFILFHRLLRALNYLSFALFPSFHCSRVVIWPSTASVCRSLCSRLSSSSTVASSRSSTTAPCASTFATSCDSCTPRTRRAFG